ncbi:TniQ family protein [Roseinatronobacter monicus]|uniref:TniQ protein n=1 Tax=Roseinatronobacter monicus TaxID=393481 RepID=A0A543KG50_9RHOB|nr:TniQ family protein [Roseinatronobacter monicus]TQM94059.1 TniQ protein [Roseinatronobacter monicus]
MKLALTVPLGATETATGFASRLACRNNSQFVQDFVQDMGITWQSVISGDAEALSVLAELGGIEMSDLERCSFRRAAGRARRLGGEIVPIRMLRVTNQRVCPLCLAQDGPVPAAGSVLWQFEPVLACPEHAVALVELPASKFPRSPYDLSGRILDHRRMIDAAAMRPRPMAVTAFERYFAARALGAEHPPTWLDQFNVSIVWRASESLGVRIRHGTRARADSLSDQELSAALDAGFKVLAAGPHALHAAMKTSRENQSIDVGGFYTEFVMFARFLQKLEKTNETKPLLDAVRDFIERTYPIGDGEDVMGRPCAQRHVHSVQTASREFGVDWIRMQRLFQAIADTPGHLGLPAPTAHLWVQADAWSPWLRRYARALNPKKAAKRLGLKTGPFTRMVKSGILQPVASLPGLVDRFDPVEIDALLARLFERAKPVDQLEPDMAMALTAHARCGQDLIPISIDQNS